MTRLVAGSATLPGMSSWKERAAQSAAETLASTASADDGTTTCAVRQSENGSRRVFTEDPAALGWLTGFSAVMFVAVAAAVSQVSDRALARVLVGVVGLAGVGFCYRLIRMGIVVNGTRLTVRNLWRTWSVDAADIAWFAPSLRKVSFLHSGILIRLTNTSQPRIRVASIFGYAFLKFSQGGVRQSAELTTWLLDAHEGRAPRRRELVRTPTRKWIGRIGYSILGFVLALAAAFILATLIDPVSGT